MNKIEQLKLQILGYKNQLSMLCDEDYYHCCDMIEQLKLQIELLEKSDSNVS